MKLTLSRYQLYVIVICIAVGFTFFNSVGNGYNMDDYLVTQHHPLTSQKNLKAITQVFNSPYYTDNMGYKYGYRPITLASFFIEHYFLGEHASTSHLINIVLYGLVVLLLFKLIASLKIPNALTIAFVASLFFAVYPIHAEVVNSIKNRDEILALLFALLSFISVDRFSGNNYGKLVVAVCYFILGLLSKKSILPLAFVMPISMILLQKSPLKTVAYTYIALVIPALLIGSDFTLGKLLLPAIFSVIFMLAIFVYYYANDLKNLFVKYFLTATFLKWGLTVLSLALCATTILYKTYFPLALLIPIYLFLYSKEKPFALALIALEFALIGLLNNYYYISLVAIFTSINLLTEHYKNGPINWRIWILNILAISSLFYSNTFYVANAFYVASIFLFFITYSSKTWIAILTCLCHLIIPIAAKEIPQTGIFMLLVLVNNYTQNTTYRFKRISGVALLGVMLVLGAMPYINNTSTISTNITQTEKQQTVSEKTAVANSFNEGRTLLYIENTLVEPHTKTEHLFTGLETLYEYTRLLLYPNNLAFYYGYSYLKTANSSSIKGWISLVFYSLLILVALYFSKRQPIITLSIFWYISCILLFSNWVELVAGMVGERLAFTASAGFTILIASVIVWIKPNLFQSKISFVELALSAVLLLLSIRTFARNEAWKTPISLMSADIVNLTNSAQANNIYAISLMASATKNANENEKQQQINKAILHFKKAIFIYPNFFNAHMDLARVYILIGDLPNAKNEYIDALKIDSSSTLVLEELVKICFDLQETDNLIYYASIYLEKDPYNEKIIELVAHHLFIKKDYIRLSKFLSMGLNTFPNNAVLNHIKNNLMLIAPDLN